MCPNIPINNYFLHAARVVVVRGRACNATTRRQAAVAGHSYEAHNMTSLEKYAIYLWFLVVIV